MATKAQQRAASAKPGDPAISDVSRGVSASTIGTEDERRAEGKDASTAEGVGEHDDSPEANAGVSAGGSFDTYADMPAGEHPNMTGAAQQPLVLGQAPVGRAAPLIGSKNLHEKHHPAIPNAINQSPVVRGVDENGARTQAPDFVDLKNDLLSKENDELQAKDATSGDASATETKDGAAV